MSEEKKEPWMNYLALTTIIFAVCATLATFKGGGYSTRSLLSQAQESDQWSYYQSKSVKQYIHEAEKDELDLQLKRQPKTETESIDAYQNKIKQLTDKIDMLLEKHEMFSKEISELRNEIYNLKASETETVSEEEEQETIEAPPTKTAFELQREKIMAEMYDKSKEKYTPTTTTTPKQTPKTPKLQTDIEKFIGENLINKIGIFITIIGVAIGAKYSIDHQLISPLTRIILGYLVGVGLLGVGLKLKKNPPRILFGGLVMD